MVQEQREAGTRISPLATGLFGRLSGRDGHGGLAAIVTTRYAEPGEIPLGPDVTVVALDRFASRGAVRPAGLLRWDDTIAGMEFDVQVVDPGRWENLCDLFGPNGTYRGCWCMTWRISDKEFRANGNDGNRRALQDRVRAGDQVGLIGYRDSTPVVWCSVAPRSTFPKVLKSTAIPPAGPDDVQGEEVWSVVCFFVRAGHRRQGLMDPMLAAAVDLARDAGATAVEGYPMDTEDGTRRGAIYSGTVALFERSGFTLHRRPRTGRRVIMRRELG